MFLFCFDTEMQCWSGFYRKRSTTIFMFLFCFDTEMQCWSGFYRKRSTTIFMYVRTLCLRKKNAQTL